MYLNFQKILNPTKPSSWSGADINLSVDGVIKKVLPTAFTEMEYCLPFSNSDKEIGFQSTGENGVCITSLTVNENQIFVGKFNNLSYFWIDDNHNECIDENMSTPYLTIKNGEITSSFCKGLTTLNSPKTLYDCIVSVFRTFNSIIGDPEFSSWNIWSSCSRSCGEGERTRVRTCTAYCENVSSSDKLQTEICKDANCELFA